MQEDIKLKIGADTTQAKKDIDNLGKKEVEIKTKVKKPEKNFFKEIEQEANKLGKKVSDIKLKKENFSKEQIKELRKEIEVTALKAKTIYFSEGNRSAEELTARLKEMHKALAQTKAEAKQTQDVFSKMDLIVGNLWSTAITNGIGALKNLVVEGAKFNRELEYADKKIQSISEKSSFEIESNIGKLSLETGTSPLELRNGLYEIISAVGDVKEAYDLLKTANKLAITGFTDIGNAVDGLTTVLNAYRMELSEAEKVANVFVKTQKLGKITVDEFSRDLFRSVPLAKQLGIGIEDIATSMAVLTSVGVKPAEGQTQLASFFRNALDENGELFKAFKKQTGVSFKEYLENGGDFIGIFEEILKFDKSFSSMSMDSEAKNLIAIFSDLTEKFREFKNEISSGENVIDKNMTDMMSSQEAATNRAKIYWQELGRTVGSVSSQIVSYIGDVITGFDRLGTNEKIKENNLSKNLEKTASILKKLQDGTDLTEDEQKKLNENMIFFSSFAPEISNAYRSITNEAERYKTTIEEIIKAQEKLKAKQQQDELNQLKRNIILADREIEKVKNKIGGMFQVRDYKKGLDGIGTPQYRNLTYEELMKNGLPKNVTDKQREIFNKFLTELEVIKSERQSAVENLNNFYTEKSKSDGTYKPQITKKTESEKSKESVISTKSDDELEKEKLKKEQDYRNRQLEIETDYNNARLKATQEYNTQMAELKGKGTEQEIQAIKEAYQKALTQAEFTRQKNTITNKMENTFYDNENDRNLNNKYLQSEKDFLIANNEMELSEQERIKAEEDRAKAEEELKKSLDNVSSNLRNLSSLFQTIGDNTNSTSLKNLANIGSIGSTIFDTIRKSSQGEKLLGQLFGTDGVSEMLGLENFAMGAGIGSALSGALGGGTEGNIGSTLGALAGSFIPIPGVGEVAGSILGGTVGGAIGSVFGSKSKKKKKREEKRRKEALERLKKGQISGQYAWQLLAQDWAEEMEESGLGTKISTLDKVSANINYDNNLSMLENAKRGKDGVSMTVLRTLMPQYNDQEIMEWFKSVTGGAVLNGDTLSTGEGKYGAIDISALAQQITNVNRELEQELKNTIKEIIDFTADGLAQVVKEGFFDGIENLGDNIEKMIANSLKNAFLNTEISKNLFNGLSDKVTDYIKDMFKDDPNLGVILDTGKLEDLSFTQYIDLIKKYMEMSSDKLEEMFKELGLNMDNLTQSMDTLNKNMSKNTVSGIATNLWKQNLGLKEPFKIDQKINLEIPVVLNGKELDRYIIKTVNGSLQRSRRSGNGIGRG